MKLEYIYKALGDRNRLRIVLVLEKGPLNVTELVSILGLSQSNVSHHLKLLLDAGVVQRSGKGNWVFYSINRDSALVLRTVETAFSERHHLAGFQEDMNRLARCLTDRKRNAREFFDSMEEDELKGISDLLPDRNICTPFLTRNIRRSDLIIEVGTGNGAMIPFLLSYSSEVLAVDSSRRMLDLALTNMASLGMDTARVKLRLGEAEHLPVENSAAGVVMMQMVLHHCGNPENAVSEASRVLKYGGTLLVVDLCQHEDPDYRTIHGDLWPGFTLESMVGYFKNAGLQVTDTQKHHNVLAVAGMKGD